MVAAARAFFIVSTVDDPGLRSRRRGLGVAGFMNIDGRLTAGLLVAILSVSAHAAPRSAPWTFVVSGDSRNCGDVVMPSIAAGALASRARFYWHLGDLRFIRDFDQDFRQLHPNATIAEYLANAWPDAQHNQLEPFGDIPFFLGIGNHELIAPKTRQEFIAPSPTGWMRPRSANSGCGTARTITRCAPTITGSSMGSIS